MAGGVLATLCVLVYPVWLSAVFAIDLPPGAAIGVFAAATISSVAGFAFSALCGPVLEFAGLTPVHMVQTMMVCSIAIQGGSVFALRRDVAWRAIFPLLAGGLCALPLGVLLLLGLPSGLHAAPVGAFILFYGVWTLLRPPLRLRGQPGWMADVIVGASGGITGGLAAFPGAAVAVWCGLRGWQKEKQRGVTQAYILCMQVAALVVIALMAPARGFSPLPDAMALAFLPAAAMGTVCGLRVFRELTDRQFGKVVSLLLVAGGLAMLL